MNIVVTLVHHPTLDRPEQLGMTELMSLLTAYGIACAAARLARSADEAAAAAAAIGFPVALKIVSPDITHKTEAGGVVLGLRDGAAVHRATGSIFGHIAATRPAAVIHGVLVQSMAPPGWELCLAGARVGDRGPLVSLDEAGAVGATQPSCVSPSVGAPPPPDARAARTGHQGLDGLIGRFTQLLVDRPELVEIEIDPLIVSPAGAVAVDAKARLGEGERPWG
jgi:acetyltransferase